jgi:hypothetical protein
MLLKLFLSENICDCNFFRNIFGCFFDILKKIQNDIKKHQKTSIHNNLMYYRLYKIHNY